MFVNLKLVGIYAQSVILHMLPLSYDIKIIIILYQNLSILNAPVEKFLFTSRSLYIIFLKPKKNLCLCLKRFIVFQIIIHLNYI